MIEMSKCWDWATGNSSGSSLICSREAGSLLRTGSILRTQGHGFNGTGEGGEASCVICHAHGHVLSRVELHEGVLGEKQKHGRMVKMVR